MKGGDGKPDGIRRMGRGDGLLTEGDHGQVASLEVTLKTLADLGSVSGVFEVVGDGLALVVDAFCCWSTRLAVRVHLDLVFSH